MLIDVAAPPPDDLPIPNDANHRHFGLGRGHSGGQEPGELLGLGEQHRPRGRPDRVEGRSGVELARVRDRGQIANEVAGRRPRLAPRPGRGQLTEPGEAHEPLRGFGMRGEELRATEPDSLDQPPHEDVGAKLLELLKAS